MAWTDVLQSFVQTAGSAYQTYQSAQTPPFVVPQGSTVGTTPSGQTYIQQQSNSTVWIVVIVAILIVALLLLRSKL